MKIDVLIDAINKMQNPSVLGLDTRVDYLPPSFAKKYENPAEAVFEFNSALLHGLKNIIPCVKIQLAYYELMGLQGLQCFDKTLRKAKELGFVVISDAKRGDIGATAAAYSGAYLADSAPFKSDFLTVNPYFGYDGLEPFISDCSKTNNGIFILVKTSNPSSADFQDLKAKDGRCFYEHIADKVAEWGQALIGKHGYSSIGAVVGATWPEQGAALRACLPHTFFLLPGYGAQGAKASDIASCFDKNASGAIVAASRSLICAHQKANTEDFVSAACIEAEKMKKDINNALHC